MFLSDIAIKRPVFTTMVILALVVFGWVSYSRIGVELFPSVEFPVATVVTIYPGADPETVEREVSQKIEDAVSTIAGIRQLKSISAENVSQVIIMFELEVNAAAAVQDVRDKVSRIQNDLPKEIDPPKIEKFDMGAVPVITLAVSGPGSVKDVTYFARKRVKDELQQLSGVGSVDIIGGQEREIKVWVDAQKLDSKGLTVLDVIGTLQANNLNIPGGRLNTHDTEFVVKVDGEYHDLASIENQVIMNVQGRKVLVKDVARVEDGMEEHRSSAMLDGKPAVSLQVRKQSGANAVELGDRVKARLAELEKTLPPGWKVLQVTDMTIFTKSAVHDVIFDLVFGGFLAVLIVFFFLRNWRSTIISALALPTSVIGTFLFVKVMGFTFNMLSLLALSLSIGLLIDDAIVVIENIYRHMEEGKKPAEAAAFATREIGLAVLATTLSIVAVFVPVAFMEGIIGRFFYQFGLTVAFAVMISLFVSFTLTPMLASRFLGHTNESGAFFRFSERLFVTLESSYRRIIAWALTHRLITVGIAIGLFVLSMSMVGLLGVEFQPSYDRGEFNVLVTLPTGTPIERTEEAAEVIAKELRARKDMVASTVSTIAGDTQQKQNVATIFVKMRPKHERTQSQKTFMTEIRAKFSQTPNAVVAVEDYDEMASSSGMRSAPIEYNLRGGDLVELDRASRQLQNELKKVKGIVDLDTTYERNKPEVRVTLDRERAAELNVMTASVGQTVRALVAGVDASKFKVAGDDYTIRVRSEDAKRVDAQQIASLKIRNGQNQLVNLENVANVSTGSGPTQIERESRQRQISIIGNVDGLPLGDALATIEKTAQTILPAGISSHIGGMGKIMNESFAAMLFTLVLAIVMVYMVLASQFESFIHPFTIMLSLPLSLIGALGGLIIAHQTLSIMSMIGIIMLMGLVTKNAILLIDYANTLRTRDGLERNEALLKAGPVRLRPILMTTAAMIFGMLPVIFSQGDGAEMRRPMGVCVVGGLIASTLLTLIVVPVVYTFMDDISNNRWLTRLFSSIKPAHPVSEEEPPTE